jgi:NADPH-dependent glutamate synthase beta subunit-like oxidoreductase
MLWEKLPTADEFGHTGNVTLRDRLALRELAAIPGRNVGKVAVIGSGPAGLTVAHNLALLGHQVTIFEAQSEAGGMMRLGIPPYRLGRDLLDAEIAAVLDLGVELRLNSPIGVSMGLTLPDLRHDFDTVFIGAGLARGRDLNIPGADLDGVLKAIDFLINVNRGYQVNLGTRILVIGGGNVAVDAARMAARTSDIAIAEEQTDAMHAALDVARTALRLGVADVHMIALEDWHELPAQQLEIQEALEEGIKIHTRLGPSRIVGRDGKVAGLETIKVASVFDTDGRFNPTFIEKTEAMMEGDTVILAIGQAADLDLLDGANDIAVSPRGLLVADEHGRTSAPDVFAGGDVVHGPRLLIEAVGDGARAALAMDMFIQQREPIRINKVSFEELPGHHMPYEFLARVRQEVPTLPLERRIGIAEVETGYTVNQAIEQAQRCLECGINTVFDSDKCIVCGGCVDVCPWDCLKIVQLNSLTGDPSLDNVLQARYGDSRTGAAMIKDENLCTRCGLCAMRCPTSAITMEAFTFKEELTYGD